MPPKRPAPPESSDDTATATTFSDESISFSDDTATFSDDAASFSDDAAASNEGPSSPSSPSVSLDSTAESDASSSSLVVSDVSSGSEPEVFRTPCRPVRSWPAADEIALLEAVASHRQKHGRLPPPDGLAASLRGRLLADERLDPDRIARQLHVLHSRYHDAANRLSRGIVPVKDDDLRIYKISKLIWDGWRRPRGKRAKRANPSQAPREFPELAELYPCLAAEVETIDAECPPAKGVRKRAFGCICDDSATQLEAKVKRQRLAEAKAEVKLHTLRTEVASKLMKLIK